MFFPFGFGFDRTIVLMLPAFAFAMWAQWKVKKIGRASCRERV